MRRQPYLLKGVATSSRGSGPVFRARSSDASTLDVIRRQLFASSSRCQMAEGASASVEPATVGDARAWPHSPGEGAVMAKPRFGWGRSQRVIAAIVAVNVGVGGALAPLARATTIGVQTPQSERIALEGIKWTSNVKVTVGSGEWTFRSSGIPAAKFLTSYYAVPANPFNVSATGAKIVSVASALQAQNYDFTLPLTPAYTERVTPANMGPIGVMLDGGVLYNPYEANHSVVATSDNFVLRTNGVRASFIDSCDGHPGGPGEYHYHGLPECLVAYATGGVPTVTSVSSTGGATTAGVRETNAASKRPVILGVAFDGFGIYDNVAMNGATIPAAALDSCNGIFSAVPGYPRGLYHYVLENVKGARSSIACYHGVVSSAFTTALRDVLGGPRAGGPQPRSAHTVSLTATAQSLAANPSDDSLLLAVLQHDSAATC